jgi:hypothetical protein
LASIPRALPQAARVKQALSKKKALEKMEVAIDPNSEVSACSGTFMAKKKPVFCRDSASLCNRARLTNLLTLPPG